MGTLLASGKPGQELSVGPNDPVWSSGFLTLGRGKEEEAGRAGSQRPGLIGSVETRLSDSAAGNMGGLFTSLPVGPARTWDPLPRFQAPASCPSVSAARGGQAPPCCL